jgi:hypothetical protein
MDTYVPDSTVKEHCPGDHLYEATGADGQVHMTCESKCKHTERNRQPSAHICCQPPYHTHATCAPIFQYLRPWVKQGVGAYLWPLDNYPGPQSQQTCNMGYYTQDTLGGQIAELPNWLFHSPQPSPMFRQVLYCWISLDCH